MGLIKPEKNYHELKDRTKSWWVMLAIFTFAIYTNRTVSLVFFALISFLALKEFFSMIATRRADHRALFCAYLAIPYQYYLVHISWYGMFIISIINMKLINKILRWIFLQLLRDLSYYL